jgi:crystallin, alpha B
LNFTHFNFFFAFQFQANIDVAQFQPNEISVKTIDNTIVVEGIQAERNDNYGSVSRQFIRKYALPKGYEPSSVMSSMSSDGVLTIKVSPPQKERPNERIVQIQHTGPALSSIKQNPINEAEVKSKK